MGTRRTQSTRGTRSKPTRKPPVEPVETVRERLRAVRTRQQAARLVELYERKARANLRRKHPTDSTELGELGILAYMAAEKVKDDALIGRLFRATTPMWYRFAYLIDRPKEENKYQKMKKHIQRCRRRYRPGSWQMRLCVGAAYWWLMSCRWSDLN